jgi:hypothetical protein
MASSASLAGGGLLETGYRYVVDHARSFHALNATQYRAMSQSARFSIDRAKTSSPIHAALIVIAPLT